MTAAVRTEYESRLEAANVAVRRSAAQDERIANGRLLVFAAAVLIAVAAIALDAVSWVWLLAPLAAFVWLVAAHSRTERSLHGARRRCVFYEQGLARLDGTWPGTGADGERFQSPEHPYSEHLDVFGRGSLFQLISFARTPRGEEELAAWLSAPAPPVEVRSRQSAVAELRPRLGLREDIALLGETAVGAAGLAGLPEWGEAEGELELGVHRWIAHLLPVPTVVLLLLWGVTDFPLFPSVLWFMATVLYARRFTAAGEHVVHGAETSVHDLDLLKGLLERLERERFEAGALRGVSERLGVGASPASVRIVGLHRLIGLHDWARNQFFAPFALALLWPLQMAYLLETWRRRNGMDLRRWIEAVAEFEALSSLAGYAAEHADDPFPDIVDEGPLFDGSGVGHPLLLESRVVRNDLVIDPARRVYVVSGSNMSGKSTLLRTIGTNTVLALAGAPVRASRLTLSPLTIGASIHVHDSLLDGESRFYAEVSRIGRIVGLGNDASLPLLFLLDELFHGTNSHDRRVGAAAVVRALLAEGAVGLVTTHDLELARIAEDIDSGVVNVHFEDQFEAGRMSFDYRMRPGVVTRSNALALMRAVGLDV